jgi:hypothetical protein
MSQKKQRSTTTRRQFLRGVGGFSLALPFLPSIVDPREAKSATAPVKRFVAFATTHGAIWGANMYPADSTLTDSMTYAGRTIKRGKLAATTNAGTTQLSAVLSGPSTLLTPSLVSKMNLIRGCDVPFYIGHHTGGHLGNYARNDGNGADGVHMHDYPTPTIDQIMAWSPKFYPDLSSIRERSLTIGPQISYNYANPSTPQSPGPVQEIAGSANAADLFNQIFVKSGAQTTMDPNAAIKPVVDRVFADYMRLRNGNTRLSSDDRHRLDDHMQRLSELQRRLSVNVTTSCPQVMPVTDQTRLLLDKPNYEVSPMLQEQFYGPMIDVIVAAIMCDTSRIAAVDIKEDFSSYVGDWHADIAHHANMPDGVAQKTIVAAHQLTFQQTYLNLCAKLDVDDGTGKTYLDNSLVVWTHEAGEYTHMGQGQPIVTAGSAGGFLSTGNYVDYRNPAFVVDPGQVGNTVKIVAGLLWQQWLGTALQAMGLSPSDYEKNGLGGYPGATKFVGSGYAKLYPDDVWNVATQVLPYLKA